MKALRNLLLIAASALTMTACATNYGCPGMPKGVQCMNAEDVYEATHNGNIPRSMNDTVPVNNGAGANNDNAARAATQQEIARRNGEQMAVEMANRQVDSPFPNYLAPALNNRQIPIRAPAQVMRIWVGAFEDQSGDLIVPGLIYTEIEDRRWILGDQNVSDSTSRSVDPLRR